MVTARPGFEPGKLLAGKYRIERVIGAGGMGVVVAATHLALNQRVAIKVMLGTGQPADVTRFVREARVTVRLRSPHVARVLDVEALDDGTPYIVLEYLEGRDFSSVLREHERLPVCEAVDAILQAAKAIREAHSLGIVHRDLKPANLFATTDAEDLPCVKVLDFGIAKWAQSGTEKLEATGVMGSAPYMAPEQIAAPDEVDARTDVWALGATLFQLLTGKTPFQYEGVTTAHAMIHAVLHRPPLRPQALQPALPAKLEAVLLRCLEKDPAARFQSITALSDALAPFSSDQPLPASQAEAPAATATPTAPRSKRALLLVSAGTLLLGVTIGAAVGWRSRAPASTQVSPAPAASAPASAALSPASAAAAPASSSEIAPAAAQTSHPQPPLAAAPDRPVPVATSASAALGPVERPAPATAAASSPRAPQPTRGVSSTASAPASLGAASSTTRPKELYGERR